MLDGRAFKRDLDDPDHSVSGACQHGLGWKPVVAALSGPWGSSLEEVMMIESDTEDRGDLDGVPEPGAKVWVRSVRKTGEVLETRGKQVVVALGPLRMTVDITGLGRVAQALAKASRPGRSQKKPTAKRPKRDPEELTPTPKSDRNSLDLRGVRRDEVADRLENLLDRAFRDEMEAVWIIHGHGTGAVREEVRTILTNSPYVDVWRAGRHGEGGNGVSIAWPTRHD